MKVKFLAGHDTHERERLMRRPPPIWGLSLYLIEYNALNCKVG